MDEHPLEQKNIKQNHGGSWFLPLFVHTHIFAWVSGYQQKDQSLVQPWQNITCTYSSLVSWWVPSKTQNWRHRLMQQAVLVQLFHIPALKNFYGRSQSAVLNSQNKSLFILALCSSSRSSERKPYIALLKHCRNACIKNRHSKIVISGKTSLITCENIFMIQVRGLQTIKDETSYSMTFKVQFSEIINVWRTFYE